MASKDGDAQEALFAAIEKEVGNINKISSVAGKATALQVLANAYRLTAGGPQAGS